MTTSTGWKNIDKLISDTVSILDIGKDIKKEHRELKSQNIVKVNYPLITSHKKRVIKKGKGIFMQLRNKKK